MITPISGIVLDNLRSGLDPVQIRHADVHDHQIRPQFISQSHGVAAIGSLAHDFDPLMLFELQPKALAHHAVVICDEYANHPVATPRQTGTSTSKIVPFSGWEMMVTLPSSSRTRS